MEVSDRSVDPGIAENSGPLCVPCLAKGKTLKAHGFCNSCKEYMCPSCVIHHGKQPASEQHDILGKQKMPTHYPPSRKAEEVTGLEHCKEHPQEAINFFCRAHRQLFCGNCIALKHKDCKIDYIPDVAHSFTASNEFKVIVDKVAKLETDLNSWERKLQSNEQSVIEINKVQLKKLEDFRVEINEYLNKREMALIKSMEKAKEKDTDLTRKFMEDINAAKSTLAEMKERLKVQDKNADHAYVAARHALTIMGDMQTLIKKVETENTVTRYHFIRDTKTECLLLWKDAIGKIEGQTDFFTAKRNPKDNMNIKHPDDKEDCHISGSAFIRPGTLLLADCNNRCVKTLDLTTGKVSARLDVDGSPWDVFVQPDDMAAVTLMGLNFSTIKFISTRNALTIASISCIFVDGWCKGIALSDGRLYLIFKEPTPRIEVRTVNGDILQTFDNTTLQKEVFRDPQCLIISRDDVSTIYVADNDSKTVSQLSLQGELLHTFSHNALSQALVDVDGSQVIVVCHDSNTVIVISGRDGRIKTMLGTNDGIKCPLTVAFCPTQKTLVVGGENDHVCVYKLI
ncbi:uncharacterized protein LOC128202938 [Mya arenaria]|uniref:uncharacterized protein LOC128202938 n=1 Tax=Mya arenaria TaxID=6604 RepID=UPI0022E2B6D9|nr:uncharacterized protein LOC128202938 [Mya arenaria]